MTRTKLIVGAVLALGALAVAAFFTLRPTPLEEAITAMEERDYFFVQDPHADPGLRPEEAVLTAGPGQQPSVGPVPGLLTHDSPGRGSDLQDMPVYMFVVDDFEDRYGPIMPDAQPSPAPHAIFVYELSGAHSVTAVPITD